MRAMRCAAVVLAIVVLPGCAMVQPGPARTMGPYDAKASRAVSAAASSVESGWLVWEASRAGRLQRNAAVVALNDAEGALAGALHAFEKVESPGVLGDERREEVRGLLVDADEALVALRSSARRDRLAADATEEQARALRRAGDALQRWLEDHE